MILELSIFGIGCFLGLCMGRVIREITRERWWRAGAWVTAMVAAGSVIAPLFAFRWAPRMGIS